MKFFDNLFDLNNRNEQLVTGLNKELNSVYVYDYFNKYINNILLVTNSLYEANDLYNRLSNYTDRVDKLVEVINQTSSSTQETDSRLSAMTDELNDKATI